jgi:hypothetical protein
LTNTIFPKIEEEMMMKMKMKSSDENDKDNDTCSQLTPPARHQKPLEKYTHWTLGTFLSHFRNERLTYPKPRICKLIGE